MKKIIILSAIISLLSVSCQKEKATPFDTSAGERIQKIWAETEETLCSAPNGWAMEFYYGYDLEYGGIMMFMKFDNGSVEIATEKFDNDYTATSYYSYAHDVSATINFDTYNEILHSYSSPSSSNVTGLGGDFEFVILEVSPERIVLRGKRTYLYYVLTPLPENLSWADQMKDYKQIISEMDRKRNYTFVVDGEIHDAERVYNGRTKTRNLSYVSEESGETVMLPFVYTFNGIKFYSPITMGEITFQELTWNGSGFYDDMTGAAIE